MKTFFTLFLIFLTINTLKSKNDNIRKISRNDNKIKKTKHRINRSVNSLNSHLNKITNLHNHIHKNGINIAHDKYNKLVARYGKLVKDYNNHRNAVCAKLPELESLHILKFDSNSFCRKWTYYGNIVGHDLAIAFTSLGYKTFYGSYILNKIYGIKKILHRYPAKNYLYTHSRNCYFNGLKYQLKHSMAGFLKGIKNKKYFKIKHYMTYNKRKISLARTIKSIVRSKK